MFSMRVFQLHGHIYERIQNVEVATNRAIFFCAGKNENKTMSKAKNVTLSFKELIFKIINE